MFKIRAGTESDLPDVLRLIVELAVYEKESEAVVTSIELMREDGFGADPVFGFFVAEIESEIVGTAIYYDRYSTWRGRCLYLEDLIVTEKHRGNGVGKSLFEHVMHKAQEDGYQGMSWQVLDWNEPAINFYDKYNSKIDAGWLNCSLSSRQLILEDSALIDCLGAEHRAHVHNYKKTTVNALASSPTLGLLQSGI